MNVYANNVQETMQSMFFYIWNRMLKIKNKDFNKE